MGIKVYNSQLNQIKMKKGTELVPTGFYDDFASGIDSNSWATFRSSGVINSTIDTQGNALHLRADSADARSRFAGIRTTTKFSVGTKLRARLKATLGQHIALGFANSNTGVSGHANSTPSVAWYMRSLDGATTYSGVTTVGSYRDEDGVTSYGSYSNFDHRTYKILEMERVDASTVVFKVDDVVVHNLTGITFANDYSAYFAVDTYATPSEMFIDWVEIV